MKKAKSNDFVWIWEKIFIYNGFTEFFNISISLSFADPDLRLFAKDPNTEVFLLDQDQVRSDQDPTSLGLYKTETGRYLIKSSEQF